ncbi:thiamine diphosphate-binding protein [Mycena maculata]|uniref:2-oxoisovalerate dehydrogenase subunit alpha n=1 Tax=Mycena maculata TaxID=230809 RepID=A0AAD7JBR5_9AGAR|nr:thiamine diphosphate-binding protein [Mycena maculata]
MAQCFRNQEDVLGKGRQMPVIRSTFWLPEALLPHYFFAIGDPNPTSGQHRLRPPPCARLEGAASEGDFHAGPLLVSTIPSPTLFIVRNNGFVISASSTEQFYGDGIDTVHVDGNDILAILAAVWSATTSNDSFAYRQRPEVEDCKRIDNPIARFRLYMESQGWWSAVDEEELKARLRADVMTAFKRAESLPRCELSELFMDVYTGEELWNIVGSLIYSWRILISSACELLEGATGKADWAPCGLLKKYGDTWELWHTELAKFKNKGQDLTQSDP